MSQMTLLPPESERPKTAAPFAELSPPRRQLLALMQQLQFGWIEELVLRGGEPAFERPPRIVCEYRLASDREPRPKAEQRAAVGRQQTAGMWGLFDRLKDRTIRSIEVRHGAPFRVLFPDAPP